MSDAAFVLSLAALTSCAAFLAGRRWGGLARAGLRAALGRTLECAGLVVLFYGFNVAVGFALAVLAPRLTGVFVSVYVNTDQTLLVFAALQAVTYQWWRAASPRS